MPPSSFDYALIRVVPRVEWEEFVNVGVILHCPERAFLEAQIGVSDDRLSALWPFLNLAELHAHLDAFVSICRGLPSAGPIAKLSRRERFHWLTAPRSTCVQVSPVHSGLCEDPHVTFRAIFKRCLSMPPPGQGNTEFEPLRP